MKNFNVSCKIDYWNPYIPPRCRKTRYEEKRKRLKFLSVPSHPKKLPSLSGFPIMVT